jgi:hypothetical protein
MKQQELIVRSAIMALEAYGDCQYDDTGTQLTNTEKADIIRANEKSWTKRVLEQHNNKEKQQ